MARQLLDKVTMNSAARVVPTASSSSSSSATVAASTAPSNPLSTPALAPTNDALKFFLANVGFNQTASQIKSYIEQYFGPVNYVKLVPHRDPSSSAATKHKGYGFLYMLTEEGSAALETYANAFPGNKIRLSEREGVYVAKHDESRVSHGQISGDANAANYAAAAAAAGYAAAVTAGSVAAGYSASSTAPYSYDAGGGYAHYYDAAAAPSQQQPSLDNYPAYYAQPQPPSQQQQQVYSNVESLQYSYAAVPPSSSSSYANVAPAIVDDQYDRSSVSQHYSATPALAVVASAPSYSQPTHQPQVNTMGYLQPQQQHQQQQQPAMTYPNTAYASQPQQQRQQTQPQPLLQQQPYSQPPVYQPPIDNNYNPPPNGYNLQQGYPAYNPPSRPIMHGHPPQQQPQPQPHARVYPHPSGGTKHPRNAGRGGQIPVPRGTGARTGGPSAGGRGAPPPPPVGGPMNHNRMGGPMTGMPPPPPPPPPPPSMRGSRARGGGRMAFHHGGGRQGGRNRDLRRDRPY